METLDTPDILERRLKSPFLVVLAVITFISSLTRLGFTWKFFADGPFSEEQLAEDSSLRWLALFFLGFALSALVSSIGAILLLLRRKGYSVYLVGQAIFLLGAICFTLSIGNDFRRVPLIGYLIISGFYLFPFIFALLYKVALKQPKDGGTL